ncbi:MAG: penicillin acylase family protein, partial [Acetobacteraceae bacterium]|nr:penicillin acylase family protein [Acetobacteraceae bacterium]
MTGSARWEARELAGLRQPAQIVVDFWGIPHIYAQNARDLFFLQGYNAARDRLWQIDLWRKRGLGLLARDFGPDYVAQDRAARMFLYRGDMEREWAAYGPNAHALAEAFVQGVNAFVRETRDGAQKLPPEFGVAGTQPDFWTVEDIVRIRSHGLTRNVISEVLRARATCAGGLDAARLLAKLDPPWQTKVPDGLDPCSVPADVLRDYQLATQPVAFAAPGVPRRADAEDPERFLEQGLERVDSIGSNNWVVAGFRTATGRPILANDPHREHSVPSLRYIVQLNAPGLNVIGAGEPALPGVSIGHNERIAFGLTIFAIDQEDLYVEALNPANPGQYRYRDGWEDMQTVRERIEVKGEAPRDVELRFTRHGPVLATDEAGHRAFTIRSVWFEPGTSAYFGSADYMAAQDWPGFLEAMARWGAPSENQVYADVDGNIGWVPAGLAPRRLNYDGLLPVPGDGRYEWRGFIPLQELPKSFDPPRGFLATANQMNLPQDYPIDQRRIGFDNWADPARWQRIMEVLASKPRLTLADSMNLQNDDTSMIARRLLPLLRGLESQDSDTRTGLELLRSWDARDTADSAAAAVFEVWLTKYLPQALVGATAPAAARPALAQVSVTAVTDLLEHPDRSFGTDPAQARDRVLLESLGTAVAEVRKALGDDPGRWAWGKLHHAQFDHALEPLADPAMRAQMRVGPLEMGGAGNVPRAATYRTSDFTVTAGASFRMVLDVGNWDNSRTINT